ncbi:MAG: plasmid stabilization protein [Devosia sp.]
MATLTIRNIDDRLKLALRMQAASHNRSMEEEVRELLRRGVGKFAPPAGEGLGTKIRKRVKALGGFDLEVAPRGPARPLPDVFDE